MSKVRLRFTGERLIPKHDKGKGVYYEHLARYVFASQIAKHKIVFDLACGSGYGSRILADQGQAKMVFGVDKSIKAIRYAKETYGKSNILFKVNDIEEHIDAPNRSPSLIIAFEVIEHLYDQEGFVKRVSAILVKNGIAMFSTPNNFNCPYENQYHTRQFYPEEFKKLLQKYFRHVLLYHQTFEFCQTIRQTRQQAIAISDDMYVKTDPIIYSPIVKDHMTQSLLAVCSQRTIPPLRLVAFNCNQLDGYDMRRGTLSLNRQIKTIQNENYLLKDRLTELTSSKYYKLWPIYVFIRNTYKKLRAGLCKNYT